jgi:SOS-response transcriptional repressor LexA
MRLAAPETTLARYSLLQVDLPGGDLTPIGVLLEDQIANAVHIRLRRDWSELTSSEDFEVLSELGPDLAGKAIEMGAEEFFRHLEDTLSNAIRITDREAIQIEGFDRALNRLYREHVQTNVIPFRTHLPRYSLRVAAGKFLENDEVTEESWIEAPEDLRLVPEMFVAVIEGHSMEPFIPDGALCVFRSGVIGSRQGRLVLVENLETSGTNRYTVKRYKSEKAKSGEKWTHSRIRLESLNPDYPSWDLEPDEEKYRIVGEFVRVLE